MNNAPRESHFVKIGEVKNAHRINQRYECLIGIPNQNQRDEARVGFTGSVYAAKPRHQNKLSRKFRFKAHLNDFL